MHSHPVNVSPDDPGVDASTYVFLKDESYCCRKCGKVLVKIAPGGMLGEKLNGLDILVILDHAGTH